MTDAAAIVACGNILGESATWSVRHQALFWVDIRAPALHRFDPAAAAHRAWPMPELCCAVVPAPDGVVLALRRDLAQFDPATAALRRLCAVEPAALGNRLNEAKCDRAGRLWVGSMRDFGAATTGALYRIDPAPGSPPRPRRVLDGVTIPNGLGWSPDGRTMLFADTPDGVLRAYEYDPDAGNLGAVRPLVPAGVLPGRPDGCAVDAQGGVWTVRAGAGCAVRVMPDGRAAATVRVPASHPTSCALGGDGLRTLFVTTARQRLSPEQLQRQPQAGHLFACRVDVPGLPEPEFVA